MKPAIDIRDPRYLRILTRELLEDYICTFPVAEQEHIRDAWQKAKGLSREIMPGPFH